MNLKLCVLVIFLCIQIRLSAIATGSPQPVSPPIEQIDPLETDSRAVGSSEKDLPPSGLTVLPEIDSCAVDQSKKDLQSSEPTHQPETDLWTVDTSGKDDTPLGKLTEALNLYPVNRMTKYPFRMEDNALGSQTRDVLKTDTPSSEHTGAPKIDHSNYKWADVMLKQPLWMKTNIFEYPASGYDDDNDDFNDSEDSDNSDDLMMDYSLDLSTNLGDINFFKKRYFNPVDSTWQKNTVKSLCEKYSDNFMPVDSTTQDESTNTIIDEHTILEHDWAKVARKELSDEVVCISVDDGKDDNSLFKTLSFWLTGLQIYDNQFRNILHKLMTVDSKVEMYFKNEEKRDEYLMNRENAKKNAMVANIEVQCAAFLLNTSIMVYNQNDKIWQSYYKDLNKKNIRDEEQCIYLRLVGSTHYDIVVDVNEMDLYLEGIHEWSSILGQLPSSYATYNEFTKTMKNTSLLGKRKAEMMECLDSPGYPTTRLESWLEQPSPWHKMIMRKKLNRKSVTPSAEDFETDRFFYPVNGDWQLNITDKLGLPCVQQHKNIDRKKLNRYVVVKDIEGDGNCLFRSLSHWATGSEKYYAEIREHIVNFMNTDIRIETFFDGPEKLKVYLEETSMGNDGVWGTEKEVIAAAILFQTSIYVLYNNEGIHEWVLYNKDVENQANPSEDERCIYIRNKYLLHYDVVTDVADQNLTPQSNS